VPIRFRTFEERKPDKHRKVTGGIEIDVVRGVTSGDR
jgi:hypothetical protein